MAVCDYCNQEMSTPGGIKTCTGNETIEFPFGDSLPAIPWDGDNICYDCKIQPGGFHHPGCDNEKCPKCGGQLIGCGCLDEEDVEEYL